MAGALLITVTKGELSLLEKALNAHRLECSQNLLTRNRLLTKIEKCKSKQWD